jgi:hypothetical protein
MTRDLIPLHPADRVFCLLSSLYPSRPMICAAAMLLDRAPDRAALQRTVDGWIARHPRLSWALYRGAYWRPAKPPPIADEALDGELGVESLLRDPPGLPPDGPPWRLGVVRGGDRYALRLVWDHALSDGDGVLRMLAGSAPDAAPPDAPREQGALGWALRVLTERSPHPRLRLERQTAARSLRVVRTGLPAQSRAELVARSAHAILSGLDAPRTVRVLAPSGGAHAPAGPLQLGNGRRRFTRTALSPAPLPALFRDAAEQGATARATPYAALRALSWLPPALVDRVLRAAPPVIVNSDAAGLVERIAPQCGAAVVDFAIRPPLLPYQGCTFAWWTFRGVLTCSITSDPALVADPDALAERLRASAV